MGGRATRDDCERALENIIGLMGELGLKKHNSKGVWGRGGKVVDHFGVRWDSGRQRFTVLERKQRQEIFCGQAQQNLGPR